MEAQFEVRAKLYLNRDSDDSDIAKKLGSGQKGYVWETTRGSALKIFERESNFNRELKCYQILERFDFSQIAGLYVPQLLGFDETLLAIEITVLTTPYLLDFGKAYFQPPDYPSDAVEHDHNRCLEDFGDYWPTVESALDQHQAVGIWYVDA